MSRAAAPAGALLEQILEQRLKPAERGEPAVLGFDHLYVPESAASWMLAIAPRLVPGTSPPGVTLVCADRTAPGRALDSSGAAESLRNAARRAGCGFVPPGEGVALHTYLERFAAPGLTLAAPGPAGAAGALGVLTRPVDGLEAAALLRGNALEFAPPRRVRIALEGSVGPGVHGLDVARALLSRLPRGAPLVEFGGAGLKDLAMRHRIAIARRLGEHGVIALFPGDEVARAFTAAIGREIESRALVPFDDTVADLRFDLDSVEPLLQDPEREDDARPVRSLAGARVHEIMIGPTATLEDLVVFARALDQPVAPALRVSVRPGSRRIVDAGAGIGLWKELESRGVTVAVEATAPGRPGADDALAPRLGFGMSRRPQDRDRWLEASPEACAAAARDGRVTDPRERGDAGFTEPAPVRGGRPPRVVPPENGIVEREVPSVPTTARWGRGIVLARLPGGVGATRGLALGARGESMRDSLDYLATRVLANDVEGLVEHATAQGGGYLMTGPQFGGGEDAEVFAVALADLGIRGVIATSFGNGAPHALARAGVLALEDDGRISGLKPGDEIEIPGLPAATLPGAMLTVRNLTRGSQRVVRHAFDAMDAAIFRDGGWVAPARGGA